MTLSNRSMHHGSDRFGNRFWLVSLLLAARTGSVALFMHRGRQPR